MPRRRGRRQRTRRGPRLVKYSFSIRASKGRTVTYGALGISADFPLRVRRLTLQLVSNTTISIQLCLHGVQAERIAQTGAIAVGQATVRTTLSAPRVTDFHLPANDEAVFTFNLQNAQNEQTTLLITGEVFVEINSPSSIVVLADED